MTMPYDHITDLPPEVRDTLTPDEQAQWLAVFNAVYAQTQDDEKARMAAWGAVRKGRASRSVAVVEDGGQVVVKGWGMKFTGPWDPDLYGEHFSTLTSLLADFYKDAPLWYEHGIDLDYGWAPIGRRHRVEIYGFGVWAEHTLFPDHPLYARTRGEIERGELSYSSDSIAHYVEVGFNRANGELRAWPLAGWSLTRHPAEPGLGPVTLDGLEAVIREMVAAPSKRYPLGDGRAVVTVAACKSIHSPQDGPTAPADTAPPLSAASSEGPSVSVAREARDGGPDSFVSEFRRKGDPTMDPEMLAQLAQFLGVEATPEAVTAALQDLIARLQGGGNEGAVEAAPDGLALRSALDLDEEASDSDVIERLHGMQALLDAPPDPAPAAAGDYDYGALRLARRRYDTVADRTPAQPPLPYHVPDVDDEDDEVDFDVRRPLAARSRSLYAAPVYVNRGAPRPGVADAVLAALGYRPPSFRSRAPMSAIRARLFQTDRAAKADSGDGPRGAWVLNREIAADILEPLTSQLVLSQAGAFRMPMDGIDSLTIRKMVGVPGAYWAAENTEIDGDDAKWAVATLTLRELRAPTTWPNRWLRNLAPGAESMIRDQIVKAMRLKMEYSALFGTGTVPADGRSTGQQPLGVRWTPGVTITALDPARAPEIADLEVAQGALEDSNVEETETWGWISHPRTFRTFEYMRDENGHPILRNSWMEGVRERTLVDYDYFKTTGVPKNLGAGSNESVLFFGDWQELVVGIGQDVELVVSEHYRIGDNSTFVMGVAYVDTGVMYPEAFHVHTGVLR